MSTPAVTLLVPRHWRPEVADIATTLRGLSGSDLTVRRLRTEPAANLVADGPAVVLRSDPPAAAAAGTEPLPGARLWWNDAPEVHECAEQGRVSTDELHVTFFPETADALRAAGAPVVLVPYAFAIPTRPVAPRRSAFTYSGEVDLGFE